MHRSIRNTPVYRLAQAPLTFALALALGQSATGASAGVLMDHAMPIAPTASSRFNTGLKMG
jgi:hypothetical protein